LWLGYAYLACDRKAEAVEAWEKSLALNPEQSDIAQLLKKYRRKPRMENDSLKSTGSGRNNPSAPQGKN